MLGKKSLHRFAGVITCPVLNHNEVLVGLSQHMLQKRLIAFRLKTAGDSPVEKLTGEILGHTKGLVPFAFAAGFDLRLLSPQSPGACGALDMAGNLMEWCANDKANLETIAVESSSSKVLRGGDWGYGIENAACAYCDDEEPGRIDIVNGCRLVLAPGFRFTL